MKIDFSILFKDKDFDVRKSGDARFMDQKVTPDVLCIIADCVLNHVADRIDFEFTKDDIWNSKYFNINVKSIFNKPDTTNKTTKQEYDKFTSQPLRMLAYSGVLSLKKSGSRNIYKIEDFDSMYFIGMKERNAYQFLYNYLIKVLSDSGQLRYFEDYKEKCTEGIINKDGYIELRDKFIQFIIGNTSINGDTEVRRIFPKILNIYACENNINGSIKGRLSKDPFYYSDLMYNRSNWRDYDKDKRTSRQEVATIKTTSSVDSNHAYSNYIVQKAISMIKRMYCESEIKDQYSIGNATQVHHIFPKAEFPHLAHYLENLIKLTPTQHFTKAHPNNNTHIVDKDYQLICLLAKSRNIEKSIQKGEFFYKKESFIYVANEGLNETIEYTLSIAEVRSVLVHIYNIS
jgi:hypothetical protein